MDNAEIWVCKRRYDFTERLGAKLQLQMAPEKGMSQSMFDLEFKGSDCNAQLKLGSNEFYGELRFLVEKYKWRTVEQISYSSCRDGKAV